MSRNVWVKTSKIKTTYFPATSKDWEPKIKKSMKLIFFTWAPIFFWLVTIKILICFDFIILNFYNFQGRDTTSQLLVWFFAEMSQNQNCEKKVIEEIERELNGETPNFEKTKKLVYLGFFIFSFYFLFYFLIKYLKSRTLFARNFETSSTCPKWSKSMCFWWQTSFWIWNQKRKHNCLVWMVHGNLSIKKWN